MSDFEVTDDELNTAKLYLRVDTDDDDSLIKADIIAAKTYIEAGVGEYDGTDPTASTLMYAMVQSLYDDRRLMESEQQEKLRQNYLFQSIILQLQMKYEVKQDEQA